MRLTSRILAVATAVSSLGLTALPAEAASYPRHRPGPSVKITYIHYDSRGTDRNTPTSLNGEYVRIKNTGRSTVQLRGWTVKDANRRNRPYVFGNYRLRPGKSVALHTGPGRNKAGHVYWGRRAHIWNNDRDVATLRMPNGRTADTCRYVDRPRSRSGVFC